MIHAKFTNMKSNKIEAIGLVFILVAFGWQIFEEEIRELSGETDKYQLHQKLDDLWAINSAIYTHSDINNSGAIANINYEHISNNWKYWKGLKAEKEDVNRQEKLFAWLRILLFILGSIMIIVAKYRE